MVYVLAIILTIGVFLLGYYCRDGNHNLNSTYLHADGNLKPIELKVIKIEERFGKTSSSYSKPIAKYTIRISYLVKKNDIESNILFFYDEQGKYNVGEILVFNKKIEEET